MSKLWSFVVVFVVAAVVATGSAYAGDAPKKKERKERKRPSPEQIMRDRSELARKGVSRGRSAVVLSYAGGVLFVAENLSSALHKVSEIYDRIGFAAVGRYNEFENLRRAGVRMADLNGLSYDRRDVTGRALANAYAQTLGAIFTEQSKPFEVEICVACTLLSITS